MTRTMGLQCARSFRTACWLKAGPAPRSWYSSGSPSPSGVPQDHFIKTGKREASDPAKINLRSNEYSQSGGDDMVAQQTVASFKGSKDTDPAVAKEQAGIGNVINPLDNSPASPEMSKQIEEISVEKSVERGPEAKSGSGPTRKAKKVDKTKVDFKQVRLP